MNQLKTPSGINYLEDFKSNDLPTVIYFSGAGERNNYGDFTAMKRTSFYTKFYTTFKDQYNFFIPLQTLNSYSWVYPFVNGVAYGVGFIRWVKEKYGIDKVVLCSHSMGSGYSTAPLMPNELSALVVSAGNGDYKQVIALAKTLLPVMQWHGKGDYSQNSFINGEKAMNWYKGAGGPVDWHPIEGGHGIDSIVYSPTSGVKEWIDKLFPIVDPVKPGLYVDGVWIGETSGTFENHLIEYKQ